MTLAASTRVVDAAYAKVKVQSPDATYRDIAIAQHHEGRACFISRGGNIVTETEISAVRDGIDLADHIARLASAHIGAADQTYPKMLAWHSERALRGLVAVNAPARRMLEECQWKLAGSVNTVRGRVMEAAE